VTTGFSTVQYAMKPIPTTFLQHSFKLKFKLINPMSGIMVIGRAKFESKKRIVTGRV